MSSADDKMDPMLKCVLEKGKKYQDVEAWISADLKKRFSIFNSAFGSKITTLSLSPNGKYLFYLFSTNVRAERFMNATLKIFSSARFEVYVDDQLKSSNIKCADTITKIAPAALVPSSALATSTKTEKPTKW